MVAVAEPGIAAPARPRKFYKYMSADTARVVMENATLRWSTPRTLNDPWDVQFDLRVDVDRARFKDLALERLWDAHYGQEPAPIGNDFGRLIRALRGRFPHMEKQEFDHEFGDAIDQSFDAFMRNLPRFREETRALMADSKLLCLTIAPDNVLMWTHYADQHRGVVLRFRSVEGLDSPWTEAQPVNYLRHMPVLMDEDFMANMLSGRVSMDVSALTNRIVFTKSEAFAYEQEWRLCSGAGRNASAAFEDLGFHPWELDQVVFGSKIAEESRLAIGGLAERHYPHARLLNAANHPERFDIELRQL